MLAEMCDGSIAILRDDVVMPDYRFTSAEMVLAIKEYQRLSAELSHGVSGTQMNDSTD